MPPTPKSPPLHVPEPSHGSSPAWGGKAYRLPHGGHRWSARALRQYEITTFYAENGSKSIAFGGSSQEEARLCQWAKTLQVFKVCVCGGGTDFIENIRL